MNALSPIAVNGASLPQTYEAAKIALSECKAVDECKDWKDKAAALASYARQADDEDLRKIAMQIKGRAVRRYGELLKEIEPAKNQYDASAKVGTGPSTRKQAAADAGLSERQMKDGIRAANIPEDEFEAMIERDEPATITELSDAGRTPRSNPEADASNSAGGDTPAAPAIDLGGRAPDDFNKALHFVGLLRRYEEELSEYDLADILPCLIEKDHARLRGFISTVDAIHQQILKGTEQ